MFLQKVKELFDLNIPIGRLRYLATYFVLFLILSPIMLFVTPNILIYEGKESLISLILAGHFNIFETIFYILISGIFGYLVEFYIDAKRLLDVSANKTFAITLSAIFAIVGVISEFFIPVTFEFYSIIYLLFSLTFFIFLCVKKGKMTHEPNDDEEN